MQTSNKSSFFTCWSPFTLHSRNLQQSSITLRAEIEFFVFQCTKTKDAVIRVPKQAHILYSRNPWVNHQCLGSTYSLWMTAVSIRGKIRLSTDEYWYEQIQELCLQFLQSIHHNSKEWLYPHKLCGKWQTDTNVAASETYKGKCFALQSFLK